MILLEKEGALLSTVSELQEELADVERECRDGKSALLALQTELTRLKAERDAMLAKHAIAQARLGIQEQLGGLSVTAELQALENVRDHIRNLAAEAQLSSELAQPDGDRRLQAFRRQQADERLRARWAALTEAKQLGPHSAPVDLATTLEQTTTQLTEVCLAAAVNTNNEDVGMVLREEEVGFEARGREPRAEELPTERER